MTRIAEQIEHCVQDALEQFGKDAFWADRLGPYEDDIEVHSWPQGWGDTALGFGGIGGQMIMTAQTVVVQCYGHYLVYHGGRFAYGVTRLDDEFVQAFNGRRLPGQREPAKFKREMPRRGETP